MAGPGAKREVGKVAIKVVPDTSTFRSELRKQLTKALAGFEVKVPVELDDRIGKQMDRITTRARLLASHLRKTTDSMRDITVATENVDQAIKQVDRGLVKVNSRGKAATRTFLGLSRAGWIVTGVFAGIPPLIALVAGLIAGLPSLIAAAGAAGATLWLGWDGIKNAASGLSDEIESLKRVASTAFERELTPSFEKLESLFPRLESGVERVAVGLSDMFEGFTNVVTAERGMAQIERILDNTGKFFSDLTPMVESLTRGFLTLSDAGSQAFGYLSGALNRWAADFEQTVNRLVNGGTFDGAMRGLSQVFESLLRLLNDLIEVGAQMMAELGGPLSDFVDAFGEALRQILPVLTDLIKAILPVLTSLLRMLSDIFADLAPVMEGVANAVGDMVDWFRQLPQPIKDVITNLAAVSLAIAGLYKLFSGARNIVGKFIGAFTGIGTGVAAKVGTEIASAGNAVNNSGRTLGERFRSGFRSVLTKASFIGAGALIADGIVEGFTGQHIPERIGSIISNGIQRIKDDGLWAGALAPDQASLDSALSVIQGFTDKSSTMLGAVRQHLGDISFTSNHTRDRILELIEAAATKKDPQALRQLAIELYGIETGSEASDRYLRQLLDAGKEGRFEGLLALKQYIEEIGASAQTTLGFIGEAVTGFQNIPDLIPNLSGILIPLELLGDAARNAKPPVDELGGAIGGLGPKGTAAKDGLGILDQYLKDIGGGGGGAPMAKQSIDSLSLSLGNFANNTGVASSATTSMNGIVSNAITVMSSVFTGGLGFMNETNTTVWSAIARITGQQAGSASGQARSNATNMRDGWRQGANGAADNNRNAWARIVDTVRKQADMAEAGARRGARGIRQAFSFSLATQGMAIMLSLRNGMASMMPSVISFAAGIAAQIAAVKGPLPKDRVLLIPHGQAIMSGLLEGMQETLPKVLSFASQVANQLATAVAKSSKTPMQRAAQEMLNALGNRDFFEDFTFRGASALVKQFNDQISALFYKANPGFNFDNSNRTYQAVKKFLEGLVSTSATSVVDKMSSPSVMSAMGSMTDTAAARTLSNWEGHVGSEDFGDVGDKVAEAIEGMRVEVAAGQVTRVVNDRNLRNRKR